MRYSLLSKFQGALLGAALGDFIGLQYQRQISHFETIKVGFSSNLNKTELRKLRLGSMPIGQFDTCGWLRLRQNLQVNTRFGGRIAMLGTQSLIRCNGLDVKDWKDIWVKFSDAERTRINAQLDHQESNKAEELGNRKNSTSPFTIHTSPLILHPCEPAIATLPVAMFFHENKAKLRERLGEVAKVWQDPNHSTQDLAIGTLAVGYAIARACKEKLDPATLIPETITYLGIDTPLAILLLQVQILLEQGASLEAAVIQLCKSAEEGRRKKEEERGKKEEGRRKKEEGISSDPSSQPPLSRLPTTSQPPPRPPLIESFLPIAIAFYCFLSTTEDLRLAVIRAARTGVEPQLTCSLVGALSGTYNSAVAIPVEWRVAVETNSESGELGSSSPRSALLTGLLWNAASVGEIMELAADLLAVWSGVYQNSTYSKSPPTPVVAAPYVIRPSY